MRSLNRSIIKDDYLRWLLNKIHFTKKNYKSLMECLNDICFSYSIARDESRVDDAYELREEFLDYIGIEGDFEYSPTVLEVLIALSIRIDNEYIGDPSNPNPSFIFWEMIENLGLDEYTDSKYYRYGIPLNIIDEIIFTWLERRFDRDGEGSIFPLRHPSQDQRKIEIWSQMQEYLSENF